MYQNVQKFIQSVHFRDNPYAKVDENLRQLKLYNNNDVKPEFNVSTNYTTGELTSEENKEKVEPHRFNQYVSKEIIIYPNLKNQHHNGVANKGGRRRNKSLKYKRTKNKKRRNKRNKTKRNKKI